MKYLRNSLIFLALLVILANTSVYAVPEGWGSGWSDYSTLSNASQLSPAPDVLTDSTGNFIISWLGKYDKTIQVSLMKMDKEGQIVQKMINATNDPDWTVRRYILFFNHDQLKLFYISEYNGNFELRFTSASSDFEFSSPKTIKTFSRPVLDFRGVEDSAGNYHFLWTNSASGNHEIYYNKLTPDLKFEIDSKQITSSPGLTTSLNCAIDSQNRIHLIYHERRSVIWELEYLVLDQTGNLLRTQQVVDRTREYPENISPEILIDHQDQAYIFWCALNRGGFDGGWGQKNYDIYYTVVDPDLQIKYTPIMVSVHPPGTYETIYPPTGFVDQENKVHLIWPDSLYRPMSNVYRVIKDDQFLTSPEKLTISITTHWLPTLKLDAEGNKHLFFMEIINKGQTNLSYMNTRYPAEVTYWIRYGLDEDNLLASFFYRFGKNLIFAGLGIILSFVPLFASAFAIVLLEKQFGKLPTLVKGVLIIGLIIILQNIPIPIASSVVGVSVADKVIAGIIASMLLFIWLFLTRKKIKFIELLPYALGGAIWIYLYTFILLWPNNATLLH